jgi:hypothetical protein
MSIARTANAVGITLADMFAGLEQGAAPNPTGKPVRKADEVIRVGKNAIKIEKQPSPKKQQQRSSKPKKR